MPPLLADFPGWVWREGTLGGSARSSLQFAFSPRVVCFEGRHAQVYSVSGLGFSIWVAWRLQLEDAASVCCEMIDHPSIAHTTALEGVKSRL